MQITRAVVPAGGRGTRLLPLTRALPKEMLPLGTAPVIQGVAEEIVAAGVTDILIITGQGKRAIEDHFDPGNGSGDFPPLFDPARVRFYATRQGAPRGLGDAIRCGERFVGDEHFVVALGDCIIVGPEPAGAIRRMLAAHLAAQAEATILVQRVAREATRNYGIVAPGEQFDETAFVLEDIVEKPGPDAAPSRYAVCARYVFSPMIFNYLRGLQPGLGAEVQLTDAIRAMIAAGHRVLAAPLQSGELRLDAGNFESYSRAFVRSMLTDERYGERLRAWAAELLAYLADPVNPDPDRPGDE